MPILVTTIAINVHAPYSDICTLAPYLTAHAARPLRPVMNLGLGGKEVLSKHKLYI